MAPHLALALLVLGSVPAAAEPWRCIFTVECDAARNICDSISPLQFDIVAADHEGQLCISDVVRDRPAERMSAQGDIPAHYAGDRWLMSVYPDSTALYTEHAQLGRPTAFTYFGTCEGLT